MLEARKYYTWLPMMAADTPATLGPAAATPTPSSRDHDVLGIAAVHLHGGGAASATPAATSTCGTSCLLRRQLLPRARPVLEGPQVHVNAPQGIYLLAQQVQLPGCQHLPQPSGGGARVGGGARHHLAAASQRIDTCQKIVTGQA